MSYTDCVARISELDSLMRSVDPDWAWSGQSLAGLIGSSSFASILGTEESESSASPNTSTSTLSSLYTKPSVKGGGGTNSVYNLAFYAPAGMESSLTMRSPLSGGWISQSYGPSDETLEPSATINGVYYAHFHNGIDIADSLGTPVLAAASGTVTFAGAQSDGCVVVKVQHSDGYTTLYAHLDPSLNVKVGDPVAIGTQLGKVGMTGMTTGPHLHFALYAPDGTTVNPTPYLSVNHLPPPQTLMGPSSTDRGALVQESTVQVLAHWDAVSSQIPYAAQIREAAISHGMDPFLLAGLVYAESRFDPNSLSSCGAMGLTQLMPDTARSLGCTDPYDPGQNANGGAAYISAQLKRFGRVDMALAAYNAGPYAVLNLGKVPDSKWPYVNAILNKWTSYQGLTA